MCDDTKALGVECEDGSYFEADYVVSGVHPLRTLEMLEDVPLIRPAYRKRLLATKQTVGGFAVYLHFKENTVPYMNYNYYAYSQDTPWGCEDYTPAEWPKGYLYMHFCHQPSPRFAQAGVVLSYMQMKDVENGKARRWDTGERTTRTSRKGMPGNCSRYWSVTSPQSRGTSRIITPPPH